MTGPRINSVVGGKVGIIRYNGTTGQFIDVFAAVAQSSPFDLVFGPDGDLYVTMMGVNEGVYRFNGSTGAFMGVFASAKNLQNPFGLVFDTYLRTFPPPPNKC